MTEQSFDVSGDTVTVWHIGNEYQPDDRAYRQRYGYRITTDAWEFVGNDIRSGCSADVDVADAARCLFSFLSACAESRQYRDRGWGPGENADLFPEHVGQWAERNDDEISLLSMDPEEIDV